jgi:hypothetical protein
MRYLIVLLFLTASCTQKPVCKRLSAAAKLSSVAVASLLDCSNLDAIEVDLVNGLKSFKFCEAQITSNQLTGIPLICEPMSLYISDKVKKLIPSEWGCKGGTGITFIQSGVYQACMSAMPVSQK